MPRSYEMISRTRAKTLTRESILDSAVALFSDAWFDEVALAWEINSCAWHLLPQYYANEVKRTAGLTAEGVAASGRIPFCAQLGNVPAAACSLARSCTFSTMGFMVTRMVIAPFTAFHW